MNSYTVAKYPLGYMCNYIALPPKRVLTVLYLRSATVRFSQFPPASSQVLFVVGLLSCAGCLRRRRQAEHLLPFPTTAHASATRQKTMPSTSGCSTRTSWRKRQPAPLPPPPAVNTSSSLPSAARWLIGSQVPRRKFDDPDVENFLKRGEPLVITGGPLVRKLVGKWSFDYLARSFGPYDGLNVHFAPRETTVFARHYGTGLGKGGCTPMSFADFVRKVRDDHLDRDADQPPSPLRYYLQSLMVWNDAPKDVHGGLSDPNAPEAPLSKAPFGPAIEQDVHSLDWDW